MDSTAFNLEYVKDLLTDKVLRGLRALEAGDETPEEAADPDAEDDTEEEVDLLGHVSLIVQTFANAGLLEFIYLPLGSDEGFVSPSGVDQTERFARFSIDRAYIDEDAQDVVTLQGEVVQMSDPEPIIEIQEIPEAPETSE